MHLIRQWNCSPLRCSWSIAYRRCSNCIFIDLTPGFNGLGKDNCKTRQETFKFWDLVCLILEILRYFYVSNTWNFMLWSGNFIWPRVWTPWRDNSIANALELRLSSTNPSICICIKLLYLLGWHVDSKKFLIHSQSVSDLNQCKLLIGPKLGSKLEWNLKQNSNFSFKEMNVFEPGICVTSAILFKPCSKATGQTSQTFFEGKIWKCIFLKANFLLWFKFH